MGSWSLESELMEAQREAALSVFTPYSRRSVRNIHLAPQLFILIYKVEVTKFPILRIVARSYLSLPINVCTGPGT